MGERLAPPVVQFLDPRVDQPGRGFALGRGALFHIVCAYPQMPVLCGFANRA
jgi:hypothetical protein